MVAITVILAAVIGTFVLGLGDQVESAPQASFNYDFDEDAGSNGEVTISHRGGDTIQGSDIDIRIAGESVGDTNIESGSGIPTQIQAGSEIAVSVPEASDRGETLTVVYNSGNRQDIIGSYDIPA